MPRASAFYARLQCGLTGKFTSRRRPPLESSSIGGPIMSDDNLPLGTQQATNFDLVLLANFVHQVVNPLNGVAGTLDNLVDGVITDEKRRDQRMRAARA